MKKRVAIIGSVGVPANYGGFETLAEQLVRNLDKQFDLTVYCSAKSYPEKPNTFLGANLRYVNLKANGFQSVPYDILSILSAVWRHQTLLLLGVAGALVLPFVRLFTKRKIIVHIDGIEWRRDKWKWFAKKFLRFSEWLAVKMATEVVVDNFVLQRYVAVIHGKQARLIEYGADHVASGTPPPQNTYPFAGKRYAFSVCRIVPENNIRTILDAFNSFRDFPIVIVGNWNDSRYGQLVKARYNGHSDSNAYLLDPIYDQAQLDSLRQHCHVYVHGHSAGGTNPSLVEAMYLQLPVVAYDVGFNRSTMDSGGYYFRSTEELVSKLQGLQETELASVRTLLKQTADKKYLWHHIAQRYAALF